MKIIFLSVFLSTVNICCAQIPNNDTWILKMDPVQLIDGFSFPNLNIQLEKKVTPHFSVLATVGYQLYSFKSTDTIFFKPKGIKLNLELRYYLSKFYRSQEIRKHPGFFAGINGVYRKNQENSSRSYSKSINSEFVEKVEEFGVKKLIYGGSLVFGYQFVLPKLKLPLIFEPHIGFGLMSRDVKNVHYNYSEGAIDTDSHSFSLASDLESSSGTEFNLSIGFRLGIHF